MKFGKVDRKLREMQKQAQQEAARQARNAYAREWRARNPDKVRQYNSTYWARKAAKANGEELATEGG